MHWAVFYFNHCFVQVDVAEDYVAPISRKSSTVVLFILEIPLPAYIIYI